MKVLLVDNCTRNLSCRRFRLDAPILLKARMKLGWWDSLFYRLTRGRGVKNLIDFVSCVCLVARRFARVRRELSFVRAHARPSAA